MVQETVKTILHLLAGFCLVLPGHGQTVLLPSWMKKDMEAVALANPSLKPVFYDDSKDALEKIPTAEAYIGGPNEALMTAGVKLRWVHIFSAGIEDYRDLPGFSDGHIKMTSLKIYQGPEIADHAFALLLHLTRNIAAYQQAQADAEWTKTSKPVMPLTELRGRTMLVIGYGGIGTQVAERAKAFGMTVNAIDLKDIPLTVTLQKTGKPDEGPAEFAKMKQGTYFINVSRGKVVNTAALVQALQEKRLAGAGLDVMDPEPLPKESPLWKMPNVIITPHVAGVSDARTGRQNALILENLGRFAKDLPLKNLVDPVKGF